MPKRLLGENLVFYRNSDRSVTALEDRCCHRNIPLSLGSLRNGRIVCAYHGWEYDAQGRCIHIPSLDNETKIPQTACVRHYPVIEKNNWIWVFMGEKHLAGASQPVDIPELSEWEMTWEEHVFDANLEAVSESLIDPYHIAFAHRDSIKTMMGEIDYYPPSFNLQVLPDGLSGEYQRTNRGNIFEKQYFGNSPTIPAKYRFYFPNIQRLEICFPKRTLLILEHVMPVDDQEVSMTQITLWKNILSFFPWFGRRFMEKKSRKIVFEDLRLLVAQQKLLQERGPLTEVSVKADEISLAFRKFWRERLKTEAQVHDQII